MSFPKHTFSTVKIPCLESSNMTYKWEGEIMLSKGIILMCASRCHILNQSSFGIISQRKCGIPLLLNGQRTAFYALRFHLRPSQQVPRVSGIRFSNWRVPLGQQDTLANISQNLPGYKFLCADKIILAESVLADRHKWRCCCKEWLSFAHMEPARQGLIFF